MSRPNNHNYRNQRRRGRNYRGGRRQEGQGFGAPRERIQNALEQNPEDRSRSPEPKNRFADEFVNQPEDSLEYLPALFFNFPELNDRIPWTSLRGCETPSAPKRLLKSQHLWGDNYAYFKREALDLHVLPENKARKLEFILGDVLNRKKRKVFSVGYVGSSHCLSLVKAARELNLKAEVVLKRCPLDLEAIEMTAAMVKMGATVKLRSTWKWVRFAEKWQKFWAKFFPIEIIPMGGAVPYSVFGYIGAICELKSQIDAGQVPKIDILYVPLASGPTLIGMEIGKRLVGLDDLEIRGVQIWEEGSQDNSEYVQLGNAAIDELNRHLKTKLNFKFQEKDFNILKGYSFKGHGHLPDFLEHWMARWTELEGIEIDRTYSLKALYGMSDSLLKSNTTGKNVLFWNTYSPFRKVDVPEPLSFKKLPRKLRRWILEEEKEGRLQEVGRL